jgi:hypothetical protein
MKKSRSNWSPSFIGIGAERSGTTWCWACLNEHPQVSMSFPKELNYFNLNYARGEDWYRKHFAYNDNKVSGEISPLYMTVPIVAQRVAHDYPNTKILAILRNPYERALSRLFVDLVNETGIVDQVNLDKAREFTRRSDIYIRASLYFQGLKPYYDLFPFEQIIIIFYDDLKTDNKKFLTSLYAALGVASDFVPDAAGNIINRTDNYLLPIFIVKSLVKLSQTAKALPVSRQVLEWVHRKSRLREKFFDLFSINKGRAKLEFDDVFGLAGRESIQKDVDLLTEELHIKVPKQWNS